MNTNFKEWLELQESLPAALAMMMGSVSPSSDLQKQIAPSVQVKTKDKEDTIEDTVNLLRRSLQYVNRNFDAFEVSFLSSLNNKLVHQFDPFMKIMEKNPKQLKKITNMDLLKTRLDQFKMLMETFDEKLNDVQDALSNIDQMDKKLQAEVGDALLMISHLVDAIKDQVKTYKEAHPNRKQQMENDLDIIERFDDLAALDLQWTNKILNTLEKIKK